MTHHTFTNRAPRATLARMLNGRYFRAWCQSCSWSGRRFPSRQVAEAEGKAHERDAERGGAA